MKERGGKLIDRTGWRKEHASEATRRTVEGGGRELLRLVEEDDAAAFLAHAQVLVDDLENLVHAQVRRLAAECNARERKGETDHA